MVIEDQGPRQRGAHALVASPPVIRPMHSPRGVPPPGQYTRARLRRTEERLAALIHPERAAIARLELAGPVARIDPAKAATLEYRPVALGAGLGPLFATYWLRAAATVPTGWA